MNVYVYFVVCYIEKKSDRKSEYFLFMVFGKFIVFRFLQGFFDFKVMDGSQVIMIVQVLGLFLYFCFQGVCENGYSCNMGIVFLCFIQIFGFLENQRGIVS